MSKNDRTRSKSQDPVTEIRLGLDDLFQALGTALGDISNRLEAQETGEVHRSFEIDTGKGPIRAEAGVRVRFAGAEAVGPSAPQAQPNDVDRTRPEMRRRRSAPEARRPERPVAFEIVEDAENWRLTADMPGVGREDILLTSDEGTLVIETQCQRHYRGRASLPADITVDDLEVKLRNGILELTARRNGAPQR